MRLYGDCYLAAVSVKHGHIPCIQDSAPLVALGQVLALFRIAQGHVRTLIDQLAGDIGGGDPPAAHLLTGGTLLVTEKSLMQREFWAFFKEGGATSFGGVPYTYEMLDRMRFQRMDLPSLRTMTQAGGKLSPELHSSSNQ